MTDEFARFELFLRRETTRLLEERLNEALLGGGNTRLDPASLAGQLSNVVNEIQAEAIRSYRNSSRGEEISGPPTSDGAEEGVRGGSDHATSLSSPYVNIPDILAAATDLGSPSGQPTGANTAGVDNGLHFGDFGDIENWYNLLLPVTTDGISEELGEGYQDLGDVGWENTS